MCCIHCCRVLCCLLHILLSFCTPGPCLITLRPSFFSRDFTSDWKVYEISLFPLIMGLDTCRCLDVKFILHNIMMKILIK